MKKEEFIHLHMLLLQVKKFLEVSTSDCDFSKYNDLDISPFQIHRSKEEHKQAIFILAQEFASMVERKKRSKNGS